MICKQCKKEFTETHHLQKYCSKECIEENEKIYQQKYRKSEKRKKALRKYTQSEKGKASSKRYNQSDKRKETRNKYYRTEKGRKAVIKRSRRYERSEKGKANKRRYIKQRRDSDPSYKLKMNLRRRLHHFLSVSKINKTNSTLKMVGCTPKYLKKHLEKQFYPHPVNNKIMAWKNYKPKGWHVDHIKPLSLAKNSKDVESLMHYTNLQPMWAEENLTKGNQII